MMIKKCLSLFLALLFFAAALAGCNIKITYESDTGSETLSPPVNDPYADLDFDPPVWRVTGNGGEEMFLFGTIHVGDERSESVLHRVDPVLSSCDALAVEFDIVAYQSAENMSSMVAQLQSMTYTDGTTVRDHIPEDLYNELKAAVEDAGYPFDYMQTYNLSFWYDMVQSIYLLGADVSSEYAIDILLINRAYDLELPVLEVESAEYQISVMADMSDELYIALIEETLGMSKALYGAALNSSYMLWLSGNEEALLGADLEEYGVEAGEVSSEIAEFNEKLIDTRNEGMVEKALEYLSSGKTVFFAVGSGHLIGDGGVAAELREAGYNVERIHLKDINN
ncbi:MAG: TraB/GumN family protein [Clostridia bacterium]|nr:TraB/GumN family protein [Clostridia bacterium]